MFLEFSIQVLITLLASTDIQTFVVLELVTQNHSRHTHLTCGAALTHVLTHRSRCRGLYHNINRIFNFS